MGEYAKRRSDGQEIKIGTCESMYYLRFEDCDKVSPSPGSQFGYYFRLPFPDEDQVKPGDYKEYNRGERLWKKEEGQNYAEDIKFPDLIESPGTLQLSHESGLLVNVSCYHGEKLPETGGDVKRIGWNGKSWSYELAFVKRTEEGLRPIVKCRHCDQMWRCDWEDVLDYTHGELKTRLERYAGQVTIYEDDQCPDCGMIGGAYFSQDNFGQQYCLNCAEELVDA